MRRGSNNANGVHITLTACTERHRERERDRDRDRDRDRERQRERERGKEGGKERGGEREREVGHTSINTTDNGKIFLC